MSISNSTEAGAPAAAARMDDDLGYLSAAALAASYAEGTLSPVEVAERLLSRIARLDGPINAVVHVDPEYTLAMARASETRYRAGAPRSALDGVPVTIKDLCRVAGMPIRRGSAAFDADHTVDWDTPAVARLREAGAVFLAKTATPDAGCKVVTRSPVHGVTANPYDLLRTPGGSSGGASAALAAGFGPLALGTDGAGSLRIPGSSTNVFALKPTFGRVPAFPHGADIPLPVVGPMARTVEDAAAMLEIISRPDPRDPYIWPVPFARPRLDALDLAGLRIATSARLGCHAPLVDAEVDALVAEAGPLLADAGAAVSEVDPVWPVDPLGPFQVFWETAYADTEDSFPEARRSLLDPLILAVAKPGRRRSMREIFDAIDARIALAAASAEFFARFDLLVGPVMPVPPYEVERDVPKGFADEDWSWCPYTYLWNMTGQPAASVPIGFTRSGLPVGVQIIGRPGGEETILRAAAAIEARRPLHLNRPALSAPIPTAKERRPS